MNNYFIIHGSFGSPFGNWFPYLRKEIEKKGLEVYNKIKIKRLVFVCGFNNYLGINEEYDNVNKSMYTDNLVEIKNYCDDIICYYSDNDPYVKYEVEKEFADTITDKQFVIENGGHLNSESGYTEFSELLEYI